MKNIDQEIAQLLTQMGIQEENLNWSTRVTILVGIVLIAYISTRIFRHIVIPIIQKITAQTKATWDDYLFNDKMLKGFCKMIPPIILHILLPFAFRDMEPLLMFLQKICLIYIIVTGLRLISLFLDTLYEISSEHERLRNRPLKGIYQMINLIAIGIGSIVIISILIDRDATSILAGLGASAAILMLIFKDSILGLVAGVQLSANDMLRPGDWITMPKYGADGDVMEVSLTTVKVRNFDKTITTIPPYALVSDSFQNWRGMKEAGGRRIKRSIFIDLSSIHFCTEAERMYFEKKGWMNPEEYTEATPPVNLKIFRDYLNRYLQSHPKINKELLTMVRQQQPAAEGLPLEIYCFADTTELLKYEQIQNEVFEHLIAMLPQFGLRVFQRPAGSDLHSQESLTHK